MDNKEAKKATQLYHINSNFEVYKCRKTKNGDCKFYGFGNPYNSREEAEEALKEIKAERALVKEKMKDKDERKVEILENYRDKLIREGYDKNTIDLVREIIEQVEPGNESYNCSKCEGMIYIDEYNEYLDFCPYCGAKTKNYYDSRLNEIQKDKAYRDRKEKEEGK